MRNIITIGRVFMRNPERTKKKRRVNVVLRVLRDDDDTTPVSLHLFDDIATSVGCGTIDCIIDGQRRLRSQQLAFARLFPLLRPGGRYVIKHPEGDEALDLLQDGSNATALAAESLSNTGAWTGMYSTVEERQFIDVSAIPIASNSNSVAFRRRLHGAPLPFSLSHRMSNRHRRHGQRTTIVTFASREASQEATESSVRALYDWGSSNTCVSVIVYRESDGIDPRDGMHRPAILLAALDAAAEGDIVAFFDAGSEWHVSLDALRIEMDQRGGVDLLAAQLEHHPEHVWSTSQAFLAAGAAGILSIEQSNQIAATCIVARCSPRTRAFARHWLAVSAGAKEQPLHPLRNRPGFFDGRDTQSTFSILLKLGGIVTHTTVPFSWVHFSMSRMDAEPDVVAGKPRVDDHGFWHGEGAEAQHAFDAGLASGLSSFFATERCEDVLDLGCGRGQYVRHLRKNVKGIRFDGIDGNPATPKLSGGICSVGDLAAPLNLKPRSWVMSIEVGEHLPKEHEPAFLANLVDHGTLGVVLSWAVPGQGGLGHFNEATNEYVKQRMSELDYVSDADAEQILRASCHLGYLRNTVMVFRRRTNEQ